MIDSIVFHTTEQAAKVWRYNVPKENIRQTDEHRFEGNIGNIKILETLGGVTMSGSVAKYLQGQNVESLTRESYTAALKKIENDTGIDLQNGFLIRVDMGASIIMNHGAAEYMRLFDVIPIYDLVQRTNTDGLKEMLYCTKSGAFEFSAYDKKKEIERKNKSEQMPDVYRNAKNILRLEYRIIRRQGIKTKLGNGADVTPWQLAEKEKYRELQKLFFDFYKSIPKKGRRVFLDGEKEVTPKELNDILAESYRQTHPEEYKAVIQSLKDRGRLSDKSIERIRQQERKNAQDFTLSDTNELIHELDAKMRIRAF